MIKPAESTVWLVFQNNKLLFLPNSSLLGEESIIHFRKYIVRQYQLINFNNSLVCCAELSDSYEVGDQFELLSFRHALDLFDADWFNIVVKAFSIINWDKNHRYCGCCGGETHLFPGKFERICKQCQLSFYPRISPSIIVLIYDKDKILMARGPHFKAGSYGLIAGFIEAGESVEAAVHREVAEEVGIKIKNLRYIGSQAWPFPDSLMLGFRAEYQSGKLQIDHDEIENAGWYRYDELPGRPSSRYSIATRMLNDFIAEQSCKA